MNEAFDPSQHLLTVAAILLYWHLLRTWNQPPPGPWDQVPRREGSVSPTPASLDVATPRDGETDQLRRSAHGSGACPPDPLSAIRSADDRFDETSFLAGAALAYERVVDAFAQGDIEALGRLLDPDLVPTFAEAIEARRSNGERMEFRFVMMRNVQIARAAIHGGFCEIAVDFVCEAIAATYGPDGSLLAGDPQQVMETRERWTFSRPLASRSANWSLVATVDD